jgi:hypothetical protein
LADAVRRGKSMPNRICGTKPISSNPNRINHKADVARASGRPGRRPRRPLAPTTRPATSSPAPPATEPRAQATGLPSRKLPPSNPGAMIQSVFICVHLWFIFSRPKFPLPANANHKFPKYFSPNNTNNLQPIRASSPLEILDPPFIL